MDNRLINCDWCYLKINGTAACGWDWIAWQFLQMEQHKQWCRDTIKPMLNITCSQLILHIHHLHNCSILTIGANSPVRQRPRVQLLLFGCDLDSCKEKTIKSLEIYIDYQSNTRLNVPWGEFLPSNNYTCFYKTVFWGHKWPHSSTKLEASNGGTGNENILFSACGAKPFLTTSSSSITQCSQICVHLKCQIHMTFKLLLVWQMWLTVDTAAHWELVSHRDDINCFCNLIWGC